MADGARARAGASGHSARYRAPPRARAGPRCGPRHSGAPAYRHGVAARRERARPQAGVPQGARDGDEEDAWSLPRAARRTRRGAAGLCRGDGGRPAGRSRALRSALGVAAVPAARLSVLRHDGAQEGHGAPCRREGGAAAGPEDWHPGRWLHGGGHCECRGAGRDHRASQGRVARARGGRVQGRARRGAGEAQAQAPHAAAVRRHDGAGGRHDGLPRVCRRRHRDRGRVRRPGGEAHRATRGAGGGAARDLRLEHQYDPHSRDREGGRAAGPGARDALLLASAQDAAARGHRHARDERREHRDGRGVRQADRQDGDRGAGWGRLLREPHPVAVSQ